MSLADSGFIVLNWSLAFLSLPLSYVIGIKFSSVLLDFAFFFSFKISPRDSLGQIPLYLLVLSLPKHLLLYLVFAWLTR